VKPNGAKLRSKNTRIYDMAIKEYIHGEGTDYQLWGNVGRYLVDIRVQEKMGNCISSKVGDIWWVNLTAKSKTLGFASARMMKNDSLYLRYFYSEEENSLGLSEVNLINKAINHAKTNSCKMVYTLWHKNSDVLPRLGFTSIPRDRGNFCRWELNLEPQDD
jgi:hypothetical protein